MALGKLYLKVAVLWLPVPATAVMAYLWHSRTGSSLLAAYATLVPLCYGYLMPFVAINLLKRWRFKNGIMMGGMYLHHGFMYAWKMSLFAFLPLLLLGSATPDGPASLAWVTCASLPYAFMAWLEDSLCVRHGFVEFNGGPTTAAETASYAPLCFTLIGFIYSSGLVWIYAWCRAGTCSAPNILLIFATTFAALFTLPSIVYRLAAGPDAGHRRDTGKLP